jgi:hypothetical protein
MIAYPGNKTSAKILLKNNARKVEEKFNSIFTKFSEIWKTSVHMEFLVLQYICKSMQQIQPLF